MNNATQLKLKVKSFRYLGDIMNKSVESKNIENYHERYTQQKKKKQKKTQQQQQQKMNTISKGMSEINKLWKKKKKKKYEWFGNHYQFADNPMKYIINKNKQYQTLQQQCSNIK